MKKKQWIFRDIRLNDQARYEVMQSLFKSKASYAAEILCFESKNFHQWFKSYSYDIYRKLVGFHVKPKMDEILDEVTGHKWDCWTVEKLLKTRRQLSLPDPEKWPCGCDPRVGHPHINLEEDTNVKYLARTNGIHMIKWRMNKFLSG